MPAGAQSQNPWLGLVNSALTAAQYKSGIDANSSIAGNVSGQLYVYPNSPVGLSVLVDTGFDFWSPSTGYTQQAGSTSPTVVTLTAPTTNPYWALIYFDPNANACGVVYGAQATTPTPSFPDTWEFIPLALIQLGVGQSTVTASQIRDIRGFWNTLEPYRVTLTVSGNTTINLMGVKRAALFVTTSAGMTLNLSNVSYFADIDILLNATGGTRTVKITASTPSGVSLGVYAAYPVWAQTASLSAYNGVNLGTTGCQVFGGSTVNSLLMAKSSWVPADTALIFR